MSVAVRHFNNREEQMDMVNSAFMKIIKGIETFDVNKNYYSWAKAIANNTVIDLYRRNDRYKTNIIFPETDDWQKQYQGDNEDVIYEIIEKTLPEEVERLLRRLPPATRLVFNLYAIDQYSYKEISANLSISYETVKWHIKEARKLIKKQLMEEKNELI